jgi:serine/threonine-protein phosphatase 5
MPPLLHTTIHLRHQAHLKLESYGYAVADADKAIQLDPNSVKVHPA